MVPTYKRTDYSLDARVGELERAVNGQPGAATKTPRPQDGWGLNYTVERLEQRVQQLAGAPLTEPLPPGPPPLPPPGWPVRETVSPLSGQRIVTRYSTPFTNPKIASVEVDGVRFEPRDRHERELAEKDRQIIELRDHAAGLEMHNEGLRTERDGARAEVERLKHRAPSMSLGTGAVNCVVSLLDHQAALAEKDAEIAALQDEVEGVRDRCHRAEFDRDRFEKQRDEAKAVARKWEDVAKGDSILLGCVLDERERAERQRDEARAHAACEQRVHETTEASRDFYRGKFAELQREYAALRGAIEQTGWRVRSSNDGAAVVLARGDAAEGAVVSYPKLYVDPAKS